MQRFGRGQEQNTYTCEIRSWRTYLLVTQLQEEHLNIVYSDNDCKSLMSCIGEIYLHCNIFLNLAILYLLLIFQIDIIDHEHHWAITRKPPIFMFLALKYMQS